ncbi:chorion class A protein L11-like isoform X3 [Nymphalis io]|uniref:chorion class A protein L11-like isoform X3 n=1 Tax=Inachis io TaxID=171585 RepID=UPI0021678608|nr:chorion class A protein L11-like isoform X3 [Nymphalis io]
MYKAVLLVCALALMIQSITGACIGAGLAGAPFGVAGPLGLTEPFGFAGPLGLAEPFGFGAPYGPYGAYGFGYGDGPYAGPFRAGYGYGAFI